MKTKTYLPENAAEIAAAAPIAMSGLVGGEFWDEVTERLNETSPGEPVEPRNLNPAE